MSCLFRQLIFLKHVSSIKDFQEQIKIECGELHFKAVADDVKFKWANNYKDFMDKVESD